MKVWTLVGAGALLMTLAGPALAKDARCFTTDDGEYPCQFETLDKSGSFEISAPGKPSFQILIEDGTATAGAVFEPGGRMVWLPGNYERSGKDPACWVSADTDTEICAW